MPAATTHRIPREADRRPAAVAENVGLVLEDRVQSVRGEQHKEPSVPQVVDVGQSGPLPPSAGPLGDVDAVAADELAVHVGRFFAVRHGADHVEPVSVCDVAHGELLNKSLGCDRDMAVHAHYSEVVGRVLQVAYYIPRALAPRSCGDSTLSDSERPRCSTLSPEGALLVSLSNSGCQQSQGGGPDPILGDAREHARHFGAELA